MHETINRWLCKCDGDNGSAVVRECRCPLHVVRPCWKPQRILISIRRRAVISLQLRTQDVTTERGSVEFPNRPEAVRYHDGWHGRDGEMAGNQLMVGETKRRNCQPLAVLASSFRVKTRSTVLPRRGLERRQAAQIRQ